MTTIRPSLALHPIHQSSADILKSFALGKPLTPEQTHFIDWHQRALSSPGLDPLLQYYLKSREKKRKPRIPFSFLLPHEEINHEAIQLLKKRLTSVIQGKHTHAIIRFTQKQYLQFREYTFPELIFWHGNQFLTGAPFIPGGIPPMIYFQWGNFFGIVKVMMMPGDKGLKANILVYFEDLQDRKLDQCVLDYDKQLDQEITHQNEIFFEYQHPTPAPQAVKEELHATPGMKFSNYFLVDDVEHHR